MSGLGNLLWGDTTGEDAGGYNDFVRGIFAGFGNALSVNEAGDKNGTDFTGMALRETNANDDKYPSYGRLFDVGNQLPLVPIGTAGNGIYDFGALRAAMFAYSSGKEEEAVRAGGGGTGATSKSTRGGGGRGGVRDHDVIVNGDRGEAVPDTEPDYLENMWRTNVQPRILGGSSYDDSVYYVKGPFWWAYRNAAQLPKGFVADGKFVSAVNMPYRDPTEGYTSLNANRLQLVEGEANHSPKLSDILTMMNDATVTFNATVGFDNVLGSDGLSKYNAHLDQLITARTKDIVKEVPLLYQNTVPATVSPPQTTPRADWTMQYRATSITAPGVATVPDVQGGNAPTGARAIAPQVATVPDVRSTGVATVPDVRSTGVATVPDVRSTGVATVPDVRVATVSTVPDVGTVAVDIVPDVVSVNVRVVDDVAVPEMPTPGTVTANPVRSVADATVVPLAAHVEVVGQPAGEQIDVTAPSMGTIAPVVLPAVRTAQEVTAPTTGTVTNVTVNGAGDATQVTAVDLPAPGAVVPSMVTPPEAVTGTTIVIGNAQSVAVASPDAAAVAQPGTPPEISYGAPALSDDSWAQASNGQTEILETNPGSKNFASAVLVDDEDFADVPSMTTDINAAITAFSDNVTQRLSEDVAQQRLGWASARLVMTSFWDRAKVVLEAKREALIADHEHQLRFEEAKANLDAKVACRDQNLRLAITNADSILRMALANAEAMNRA